MINFYHSLLKERILINFEDFKNLIKNTYSFLIELDKFKKDYYHKIFYYTYLLKTKKNQNYIAMILGMDQSTISRKLKEIQDYLYLKIKELNN